jgi:hypothetical protein
MRYATWHLYWQPDERYGTGPEPEIGGAEGAFFTGPDPHDVIVGYIYSDHDLTGLEDWNVQEITGEQALALAQQLDGEASMNDEGRIVFPVPDLIA